MFTVFKWWMISAQDFCRFIWEVFVAFDLSLWRCCFCISPNPHSLSDSNFSSTNAKFGLVAVDNCHHFFEFSNLGGSGGSWCTCWRTVGTSYSPTSQTTICSKSSYSSFWNCYIFEDSNNGCYIAGSFSAWLTAFCCCGTCNQQGCHSTISQKCHFGQHLCRARCCFCREWRYCSVNAAGHRYWHPRNQFCYSHWCQNCTLAAYCSVYLVVCLEVKIGCSQIHDHISS